MKSSIGKFLLFSFFCLTITAVCFGLYVKYYITETPLEIPVPLQAKTQTEAQIQTQAQTQTASQAETPQAETPSYVLLVTPGMSVQKMADRLAKDGLLAYPKLFVWWIWLTDARSQLKAGEYLIKQGDTSEDVINLLVSGKVIQHPLTIIEGWNFETLMQAVNQAEKLTHTLQGLSPQEIMAKLGHPNLHPEGQFFPDTYYFPLGTTDVAFLQRAYNTMQEKLAQAWEKRSSDVAMENPYQALTLASIIEKESGHLDEYSEISGVFNRRLQKGMPLQADPTVIYAAGKAYNGYITSDLLKLSNPYNTYVVNGLPPTPIAMPSEKALLAATQPKKGDSLYFVARGQGKGHIFSKTLQDHQNAVNHYRLLSQSQLPAQNQGQAQPQTQSQAEGEAEKQTAVGQPMGEPSNPTMSNSSLQSTATQANEEKNKSQKKK